MTAFFAWLWQGVVLTAVIDLLVRAMPRLNAATRHLIWWGALVGIAILAVLHASGDAPAVSVPALPDPGPTTLAGLSVVTVTPAPGWVVAAGLWAWLGIALHRLLCLLRGWRHVAGLRARAVPADERLGSRLEAWSAMRRRGRAARLCVTDQPLAACALGFRRPVILVSQHLVDTLDDEVLDQVVLHEQAHLDRFDDWFRLLQSIATAVGVIHPAVHLIGRRIDLEREAACDDRVVAVKGTAGRYAASLAEAAGVASSRVPAPVPAVFGGGSSTARSLRVRVLRLLDPRPDRGHRLARPAALVAGAWLVAGLAAAPQVPALVLFAATGQVPIPGRMAVSAPTPAPAVIGLTAPVVGSRATPAAGVARARSNGAGRVQPLPPASPDAPLESRAAPASLTPPTDAPTSAPLDAAAEALGAFSADVTDAPPHQGGTAPASSFAGRAAAEPSLLSDMSWVGRNSAATARKAGVSLAGTVTRAGKVFGKLF